MAPELFDGEPPSMSTEIYAFGVTAYELVTGSEHPYLGADTGFRFQPRFRERPLSRIPNGAGFLRELLPRLVALDPSERPASFTDVLRELGYEKREWRRSSLDIMRESAVLRVQGHVAAARELVEEALKKRPDDPALLFARVGVLQDDGRTEEAAISLEAACSSIVASRGRLEGGVYIDPVVVRARSEISHGAPARAATRLRQSAEWASDVDRLAFPQFGWLALYDGRPEEACDLLLQCAGEFDDPALACFAVAAAQSEKRDDLASEIARRLVGRAESRHAAATAVLVHTWGLSDELLVPPEIPAKWAQDLASVLDLRNQDLVPLDPIREVALLGSIELELVAGFDPDDEEWTNASSDQERTRNLFGRIAARFQTLFPERHALHEDIVFAVEKLARVLDYRFDGSDLRAQQLVSLVTAGYVWRLAEGPRGTVAKQWIIDTTAKSFERERLRSASLGRAATQCLAQGVPLGLASPGGLSRGREIFDAAYTNALRVFGNSAALVPENDRFYAYCFGVALCDVEPVIDSLRESRG
jgi:hypothetical protein